MKRYFAFVILFALLFQPFPAMADESGLNQASLKAMLEGLGYEPKEGAFNDTKIPYFSIHIPGSPWNYDITIYIDADKNIVSLNSEFGLYKGPAEDIPQSALVGLLSENASLTFAHFRYVASNKSIFLLANLRNKSVSAVDMRRAIDEIVSGANRTQNFWDPKQWPKSAAAEPSSAAPAAAGEDKK
ncbi:MAG: hypothetical protein KDJ17_09780 [Hyphomicrobiaceae bacterium]|nr:hypothetical protein [Hyphomicrobiaceae bacterium]